MSFKAFIAEAVILEGGAAIKGSQPLTQAEARELTAAAIHDLRKLLDLPSRLVQPVGSAGLKAPDQLSGDIDIAVEADVTAVKRAVEELALDGRFRHMPGLNVYSYAKLHGSKVAQVDIIPTSNIKLAKWAYHNDPADLKLGLKGSHRNELLFAIAKYAEYVSKEKDAQGEDSARERLVFDLSRGLYRFVQDRAGKRGLKKSFETRDKVLLSTDPDKICDRLLGVPADAALTFADVLKVVLSKSFKHKAKLKLIIDRAIKGLEEKKLVVPHELRAAIIAKPKLTEASAANLTARRLALEVQQCGIDYNFNFDFDALNHSWKQKHFEALKRYVAARHLPAGPVDGYELFLDDGAVEAALDEFRDITHHEMYGAPDEYKLSTKYTRARDAEEKKRIFFDDLPTNITLGDDGSWVVWTDKEKGVAAIAGGMKASASVFELYFKRNEQFMPKLNESLKPGAHSDLLKLQQDLIDDLPEGFDIEVVKDPWSHGHELRVSYRGSGAFRLVSFAPQLSASDQQYYHIRGVQSLFTYDEVVHRLIEAFAYRIRNDHEAN